jgi:hypothetical protein
LTATSVMQRSLPGDATSKVRPPHTGQLIGVFGVRCSVAIVW